MLDWPAGLPGTRHLEFRMCQPAIHSALAAKIAPAAYYSDHGDRSSKCLFGRSLLKCNLDPAEWCLFPDNQFSRSNLKDKKRARGERERTNFNTLADRTFDHFRTSILVDLFGFCCQKTSIDRCWGSKIVRCSIGWVVLLLLLHLRLSSSLQKKNI